MGLSDLEHPVNTTQDSRKVSTMTSARLWVIELGITLKGVAPWNDGLNLANSQSVKGCFIGGAIHPPRARKLFRRANWQNRRVRRTAIAMLKFRNPPLNEFLDFVDPKIVWENK